MCVHCVIIYFYERQGTRGEILRYPRASWDLEKKSKKNFFVENVIFLFFLHNLRFQYNFWEKKLRFVELRDDKFGSNGMFIS